VTFSGFCGFSGDSVTTLLEAWRAWDERPADPARARAMEDASAVVAADLDITTTALRDHLMAARRSGARPGAAAPLLPHVADRHHREEPSRV
jgi:hypothetical protein